MNRKFSYHHTPAKSYAHRLKSKTAISDEVLIITSFDYFLDKNGLKLLLKKYKEIILVPRMVDDDYLLNQTIRPLLEKFDKIHLVTNPQYDSRYHVIYELVIRNNKSIRITTVYDFCENVLKKVYIPDDIAEENPAMPRRLSFDGKVRAVKNIIDLVLSIVLFALSSILWLASAFRIRQESPGPIFYFQERTGLHQAEFKCIKFRSMGTDAEANGAAFSRKKDSRIFKYGAIMRRTRIDELPQLINIFKGDLSLIGPRPERPVFIDTFEETVPYYNLRHGVKPGITGYAQVMYPYGAGVRDARHKLMYDLYYIKHWSIQLELKIILVTAIVVFTRKGR
ncbi:sugar transferase [Arundinibacter roseus]|uniref:Sugar transferase n=1 Tax=Arundinibacter roseus TaxID=2070510 RepID=A0A4R4JX09_9BACT|nr:sugar transferase [Arundinibacter roseus]TDB58652.1 sugar transferase [Arundinibacter roseus]